MSNPIIQVNNLSKSYTITHEGKERYTALRDVMAQKVKKIFSFPTSLRGGTTKQVIAGGTTNVIARRNDKAICLQRRIPGIKRYQL